MDKTLTLEPSAEQQAEMRTQIAQYFNEMNRGSPPIRGIRD